MPGIIGDSQSAFLGGRNILDGVLVANVVDSWLKSRKSGLLFKLDFEKAFDSVNWDFLLSMLSNFGFGPKWNSWIKECVSTSRISILVNGSPTKEFNPQKDDSLLFCEAEFSEVLTLKRILRCFEVVSGLKINYHKSVICGVGIPGNTLEEFAHLLNCKTHSLLLKYLGLPLGANPKRKRMWKPIVDKVKMRLAGWKRRFLSHAGRLTRVKAVLSSLPYDQWFGVHCLKDAFPRLFQLSNSKEGLLKDFVSTTSSIWVFNFRRALFEWEKDELHRLITTLATPPPLNLGMDDRAMWAALHPSKSFVSTLYNHSNLALGNTVPSSDLIWLNYLPPKIQFFGWLAWKNKVKTSVFLQRIGVLDRSAATSCLFCNSQQETVQHVLIHCPLVWKVWTGLLQWWGILWVVPVSVEDLLQWWAGFICKKKERRI
ncbi:uncharacterized protein LOC114288189 [Camellia sinensis]|uniref:uncharacterized protein LOC114288189 n=1 Tax=Camellia sinensis TaxID=4442 RepID=UPI0010356D59|nr:uncharacterized protein LOC114288189 [Camellia sinensis]